MDRPADAAPYDSAWSTKRLNIFFPGVQINWLTEYAMIALTTVAVWTGLGAGIVIFLAGLQGIPVALEEAAMIDGANRFQSLRHVTIPLMTPIIFYQLVLSIVAAMQYFALPMLLAPTAGAAAGALGAAPTRAVYLYMVHSFRQAFGFHRYGYATALTWFLVILILIFTAVLFWSSRQMGTLRDRDIGEIEPMRATTSRKGLHTPPDGQGGHLHTSHRRHCRADHPGGLPHQHVAKVGERVHLGKLGVFPQKAHSGATIIWR